MLIDGPDAKKLITIIKKYVKSNQTFMHFVLLVLLNKLMYFSIFSVKNYQEQEYNMV